MSHIDTYKAEAKEVFRVEGLGSTMKYLEGVLVPKGRVYDSFVMLSAEHVEIERGILSGVLTEEAKQVSLAKLRGRVMYLINSMTVEDILSKKNSKRKDSGFTTELPEIDLEEIYQLRDFNLSIDDCIEDLDEATSNFEFIYQKSAPFFEKETAATNRITNQLRNLYRNRKINKVLLNKWLRTYSVEMKFYSDNLNLFSAEVSIAFYEFVRLHLILLQANYAKDGDIPLDKIAEIKDLYSTMRTTLRESKVVVQRKKEELGMFSNSLNSFGNVDSIDVAIRAVEKFIHSFDHLILYAFQFEEGLDMIRIKHKDYL